MDTPGLTIYNLPTMPPKWDRVGIFYVVFCSIWTTIVVAGMAFCWYNRHLPILKVRALPLSFVAVIFLHLYWIMAQITYPIAGTIPVVIAYDVQYFVMGTWFPLGIALFHAANLQFLRVAKLQRQFTHPDLQGWIGYGASSSILGRIRKMDYNTKVMTFISTGVVIPTLLTLGMWLICRKYHPAFGLPGTEIRGATLPEQLRDLGIGWEWWPSVVWQFVWTWGVAPVLIWRAWDIRDTMGWRIQTIGACVSGLQATPLFLVASYSPAFDTVNIYFHPSQWIHLNTVFIEIFAIFIPAYQVVKHWHTSRQVAYSNEKWETSSQAITIRVFASSDKESTLELVERDQIFRYISGDYGDRLLTMTALNRVLSEHPAPLQEFSAYHDFSGENIAFLTRVAKWKATWPQASKIDPEQRIEMYNAALKIYIDFISPHDAEFPLNLSSPQLRDLDAIFSASARSICGAVLVDPALPFAAELPPYRGSDISDARLFTRYTGEVAPDFGAAVFDEAQEHVKNLVLTNTWPKFVREVQGRRRSEGSERSLGSLGSEATVVSRIVRFMGKLV